MSGKPTPCPGGCGRMVRPYRASAEHFPWTVKRYAGGHCEPCHKGRVAVVDTRPEIRPCTECGVQTRPTRISPKDAPETKLRVGDLCRPCNAACATVAPERAAVVERELAVFFRSRRRRGIPVEGIRVGV